MPEFFAALPSPRASLVERLVAGTRGEGPRACLLNAPRGWGKRRILLEVLRRLRAHGQAPAFLDLRPCVVHPDEFASAFAAAFLATATTEAPAAIEGIAGAPAPEGSLRALAATRGVRSLPRTSRLVADLVAELARRRSRGGAVVELSLSVPEALSADLDRSLTLVGDGLDQIRRLAPFPGLDGVASSLARRLGDATRLRLACSISPEGRPRTLLDALRREMGNDLIVRPVPPMEAVETGSLLRGAEGARAEPRVLLAVTGGRPLTTEILAGLITEGRSLEQALAEDLGVPGGRLFQELKFDYHLLIERTRGHAACRAILNVLARRDGRDLSGIAARLRRSAGSTLDYLRWLVEVGLVRREGRRYGFADPLLRLYVLLHELPEHPEDASGRRALVHRFLGALGAEPVALRPLGRPPGRRTAAVR